MDCLLIRAACYAGSLLLAIGVCAGAELPVTFSEPARLASRALLIDVAFAGSRLVAVGDRGHVLLSDDKGLTWVQAASVPTQALLTGVCFEDSRRGIAVGHDEVILTTEDAGSTWKRVHYAPEAQQPLLDVWCGPDGRAIAIGAYSAYFSSDDAGATWKERKFLPRSMREQVAYDAREAHKALGAHKQATQNAHGVRQRAASVTHNGHEKLAKGAVSSTSHSPPASSSSRLAAAPASSAASVDSADSIGGGFHLNRIVAASPTRLYIAAEAGHLYRSDDAGVDWVELPSPYEGSFFGVLPLAGDALLAYGLRGNLLKSDDAGLTWQRVATGTVAMLAGGVTFGNDTLAIVGLSGVVLVSYDGGRTFAVLQQDDRKGLSAVLAVSANILVTVGEGGAKLIALRPGVASQVSR